MCGIAGFNLSPNERPVNSRKLAQYLLLGIEHRGTHATGAAWRHDETSVIVQKRDITASKWVESLSMPKKAQTAILHTRFWTQGKPQVNANNHPIQVGPIVGVHNGSVSNDGDLFKKLSEVGVVRNAEVDSEAIFALLAHGAPLYEAQHDVDLMEKVQGSAAIAYIDTSNPADELHVARITGSPLVVAQTAAGSFIFASEKQAILDACKGLGLVVEYMEDKVQEGEYFKVREGRIVETCTFEPDWSYYWNQSWKGSSVRTSYGNWPTGGSASSKADDSNNWCDTCNDWEWYCTDAGGCKHNAPAAAAATIIGTSAESPSGWMVDGLVETVNLFTTHDIPEMDDDLFYEKYSKRVEAIETYATRVEGGGAISTTTLTNILDRNHWQTRPGDWVKTTVRNPSKKDDEFVVYAQVLDVPDTFPTGDYLVRLLLGGGEYAIARRKSHQFTTLKPRSATPTQLPATKAGEVVDIKTGELVLASF